MAKKCEKDTVLLKIISAMLFSLICMYVILPLFELIHVTDSGSKPFPYKMLFPYDAYSTFPYIVTYFLTSLAGFGVVTTLFSEDSLFGFFVAYTCGQFTMLHEEIDGVIDRVDAKSKNNVIDLYTSVHERQAGRQLRLKQIIDHHNTITKYGNIHFCAYKCQEVISDNEKNVFKVLRAHGGIFQSDITCKFYDKFIFNMLGGLSNSCGMSLLKYENS